jgi:hypothetical protein
MARQQLTRPRKFGAGLNISSERYSKFAETGDYQGSIRRSLVKLRDYSLMNGGAPNWPPLWMQSRIVGGKAMNGEVGVLIYVHAAADSRKCYVVIEDENENYTGTLVFDNARLCRQVADVLQQHLGRSIKEIGDLEVSFMPK